MNDVDRAGIADPQGWNHATRPQFFQHYAEKVTRPEAIQTFVAIRDLVLRFLGPVPALDVADIGCGNGTQSLIWAELGHRVHALDVSADLLALGRQRAADAGQHVDFCLGSATQIPWPSNSMDVCLSLELLEHVADWTACVDEFARIVKPGGLMLLSTTNVLCPVQQEYSLPLYSWYPGPVKRYCERLAHTTRPQIAGYATYPAVHWFSFYQLRRALAARGFRSLDRFDVMDLDGKSPLAAALVRAVRAVPPLRWLGHVATPYTIVLAVKDRVRER